MIEVRKYRKPDGYATRHWAVYVDGELLAVVLYRKGAQAIADLIMHERYRKDVVGVISAGLSSSGNGSRM